VALFRFNLELRWQECLPALSLFLQFFVLLLLYFGLIWRGDVIGRGLDVCA
jgi:hypothetical protein